ncbi:MAG: histidine phosphatase family protein [Pseudomonadota bacterium]
MADLYILRHGNTFEKGQEPTRVGGRTDIPLTQAGEDQIKRVAEHFAKDGVTFAGVLSGPLKRTMRSAEITIETLQIGNALEIRETLREIDYGPDENQSESFVRGRIGEAALQRWDAEAIPPPGWIVDPAALRSVWRALFAEYASVDGAILCVTSNGVARFALDVTEGGEKHERKLRTAAYGIIELYERSAKVKAWNISVDR